MFLNLLSYGNLTKLFAGVKVIRSIFAPSNHNNMKAWVYLILAILFIGGAAYLIFIPARNTFARNFGGTLEVKLPPNHVVLNATWKEQSLWVVSKDTLTGEVIFWESSSWGIAEGTVKFK